MNLVLPQATVNLINRVSADNRHHPGLQLEKLSLPGDQEAQKRALAKVVAATKGQSSASEFAALRNRWLASMRAAGDASPLTAVAVSPLTLHLARASALENTGMCLHRLYGFAYLPGSGLKGMARAYAETVWLPAQADQQQKMAWRQIEDVFGWAPNADRKRQIEDPNHPAKRRRVNDAGLDSPEIKAHVGDIVFHDGWPDAWPELIVDIVNNHHPNYYQHADNQHPPGDWEDPVPVYFLAVAAGRTFAFPLTKRRSDVPDDLVKLARQWLLGALCHLGAGAKTAAGYGAFKPMDGEAPELSAPSRAVFETKLELVTPAFLAGANQQAEDCDLRSATLRGVLRWWWRTMHAGFLDAKTLRALEASIWGDTKSGSAVRIIVEGSVANLPKPYDKRSKAYFNNEQKVSEIGIPNGDARKTTQGLWYASYGMDEGGQNNPRRRYVLEPPASWHARMIARDSRFNGDGQEIAAETVLEQATAALWLLSRFGCIGSKAGKGFGSLSTADLSDWSLDKVKRLSSELRQELGLNNSFRESAAASASLEQMLGPVEALFSWPSMWSVLDQVGFAYSRCAQGFAHDPAKVALGLPRQIHGPRNQPLAHQHAATHRRPLWLRGPNGRRHTSPMHIHIACVDGGFLVRAIAFPARLPSLADSREFLERFFKDFGDDMQRRTTLQAPPAPPGDGRDSSQRSDERIAHSQQNAPAPRPQSGQRVEAKLLEERTRKGGWKATHQASGLSGPIQNSGDVPADKTVGDKLMLIVASVNNREIAFRFPTAVDEQRAKKSDGKPKSGRDTHGRRR